MTASASDASSLRGDRALLERAGSCQSHNGQVADAVAAGNVHQRLALLAPRQGLPTLMRVELWWTSEAHAALFGPLAAFAGPGADQLALEPGHPAEHSEHLLWVEPATCASMASACSRSRSQNAAMGSAAM